MVIVLGCLPFSDMRLFFMVYPFLLYCNSVHPEPWDRPASSCEFSRQHGCSAGGALPPVVAYIGSMYHTACAAIAHAKFMEPQARQKWELKLIALSRAPPKGGTLPPQASQAQKVAHQRIQVYLKELSDLLTKRGDPSLSLKQLDKLEENYGERQPGFEHELLKVPDPIL